MRELLKLEKARLAWALPAGGLRVAAAAATTTGRLDAARHLKPLDLSVMPASHGGHALLGANGSGKSMLAEALLSREGGPSVVQGAFLRKDGWNSRSIARVSFDAHQQLLSDGGSVYRALGHLTAAARFLVVRFGLHPLLYRPVRAVSTGEIRKVLLVRALGAAPELLVLDNAFDGLDVPSRKNLAELLSQMLRGFGQLLVQGVDASAAAHTQVLLLTHRAEEIVSEISTISAISRDGALRTYARQGKPACAVLSSALGDVSAETLASSNMHAASRLRDLLPDAARHGTPLVDLNGFSLIRGEAVLLRHLNWQVRSGENWLIAGGNGAGKSSLSRLISQSLCRSNGGRADGLAGGAAGAGAGDRDSAAGGAGSDHPVSDSRRNEAKEESENSASEMKGSMSVLGRSITSRGEESAEKSAASVLDSGTLGMAAATGGTFKTSGGASSMMSGEDVSTRGKYGAFGGLHQPGSTERLGTCGVICAGPSDPALLGASGVGWVSTELHLAMVRSSLAAGEVLHARAASAATAEGVAESLGISDVLARPFSQLSQGEQKLVLIGAAISREPSLLIVDEPCQGLDEHSRSRVLALLQALGERGCTSMVYITHHPEEMLPCISHVLHLKGGAAAFNGTAEEYRRLHQ